MGNDSKLDGARFNNVLLVNLPINTGKYVVSDFPPVGLGYLSQALIDAGIAHDVFDMMLGYNLKALISLIKQKHYDLIGFSMFTFNYKISYAIIDVVKTNFPTITIIAGGPHISTLREDVLMECPKIDFAVAMEGELALVSMCDSSVSYEAIPALIYRKNGLIKMNPIVHIQDLEIVSYPRYEKFELSRYSANISIITSRGCPYTCTFCPVPRTIGQKFRYRSANNIVGEIKHWYDRGYRRILVLDDNFTLLPQRVTELCNLMKSLKMKGLVLSCANGIRADKTDFTILKEMKEAGFNELAFGVESASNKVLDAISKSESIETIESRIQDACKLDYKVVLFFLIGSPTETYEDFLQSVSLALRYPVYAARFYNLIPFPHSQLFEWVKSNNLFIVQPKEYLNGASHHVNQPLFFTPEFSADKRRAAFKLAQKIEKTVKKRYIFRKTKGPTVLRSIVSYLYINSLLNYLYNSNTLVRHLGLKLRRLF